MATVTYTSNDYAIENQVYTWTSLTTTNTDGQPAGYSGSGDRTIQVTGTFGAGGTVHVQGSNDGSNWFQLKDPSNTAIAFTAAGLRAILESPLYVRPYINAGDGTTSITAILAVRRQHNG